MHRLIPVLLFALLFAGAATTDAKRATPAPQASLTLHTDPQGHPYIEGRCRLEDVPGGNVEAAYILTPNGSLAAPALSRVAPSPVGGVHWVQQIAPTGDGRYTLTCQHTTPDGVPVAVARASLDYKP
jgi:hypothetical protein